MGSVALRPCRVLSGGGWSLLPCPLHWAETPVLGKLPSLRGFCSGVSGNRTAQLFLQCPQAEGSLLVSRSLCHPALLLKPHHQATFQQGALAGLPLEIKSQGGGDSLLSRWGLAAGRPRSLGAGPHWAAGPPPASLRDHSSGDPTTCAGPQGWMLTGSS